MAVSKKFVNIGAHTIMLCRNKEKGENAVLEIKKEIPNASVELMTYDLSSMKAIVCTKYGPPDVLELKEVENIH